MFLFQTRIFSVITQKCCIASHKLKFALSRYVFSSICSYVLRGSNKQKSSKYCTRIVLIISRCMLAHMQIQTDCCSCHCEMGLYENLLSTICYTHAIKTQRYDIRTLHTHQPTLHMINSELNLLLVFIYVFVALSLSLCYSIVFIHAVLEYDVRLIF